MKVELHPNLKKDPNLALTARVMEYIKRAGAELWLPEALPLREHGLHYGPCEEPDLIFVLGGDGSIMRAARRAAVLGVPILGINLGRVGYLAELNPDELSYLDEVLAGNYRVEPRMMLETVPMRGGAAMGEPRVALNDVVISHGRLSHLLETEVFCDGSSLGRYRSDGFVVSTPTGSTAYSLSAGGPVLSPSLEGMCLTPICPHSLLARPILVPGESLIEIRYLRPTEATAYLTVDGVEAAALLPSDSVIVRRSSLTADFVRIDGREKKSFYDILREKMSDI